MMPILPVAPSTGQVHASFEASTTTTTTPSLGHRSFFALPIDFSVVIAPRALCCFSVRMAICLASSLEAPISCQKAIVQRRTKEQNSSTLKYPLPCSKSMPMELASTSGTSCSTWQGPSVPSAHIISKQTKLGWKEEVL